MSNADGGLAAGILKLYGPLRAVAGELSASRVRQVLAAAGLPAERLADGDYKAPILQSGDRLFRAMSETDQVAVVRSLALVLAEPKSAVRGEAEAVLAQRGFVVADGKLMSALGNPAESLVLPLVNAIPDNYQDARRLLTEARSLLHTAKDQHEFTTIGHKCREALQSFASTLYKSALPSEAQEDLPANKVLMRLRAVARWKRTELGTTTSELLDALVACHEAVWNLVQKAEHGSEKPQHPLEWDDARRAVLYSSLLVAELAQLVAPKPT